MLRLMAASAMLLMFASGAQAGERYVEIWNPPEARLTAPTSAALAHRQPGARKTAKPKLSANGATKPATRRVADPVPRMSAGKRPTAVPQDRKAAPASLDIPRMIGPDGNVLRVNYETPVAYRCRQTV